MTPYDLLLMLHFVGLALAVGSSFATLTLGLSARDMSAEARVAFMLRVTALGRNGSIGFAFLLVSGIGMLALRGVHPTMVAGGPAFHVKLLLVLVLVGLLGYMQVLIKRARAENGGPSLAKLPRVGRVMLVTGLATVVLAVLAFH